jgi:L-alanine-DL-glutamate epimerase-like enolase superfamily enzyme
MIISEVGTFPLRIPLRMGNRSAVAAWGDKDLPAGDSLLVKVTTDQGLEGLGEAFGFRAVRFAKLVIEDLIVPVWIDRDAARIAHLMGEFRSSCTSSGEVGP